MLISKFGGDEIVKKIGAYENKIGKKLPGQLHTFLEKYNGGETPDTKFSCNGTSSDVRAFYGMGSVVYSFDDVEISEYEGEAYLPIACDSFGNDLLIAMGSGEIFFKDHENDDIKKVAEDLTAFINACESRVIDVSDVKSVEEREQELIKRGRASVITETLKDMWRSEIEKYASLKQEEVAL